MTDADTLNPTIWLLPERSGRGIVRQLASQEINQQLAGSTAVQSLSSLSQYLGQVVAGGQHPHLAAALATRPEENQGSRPEAFFDRTLTRVLTGLLQPLNLHEARR